MPLDRSAKRRHRFPSLWFWAFWTLGSVALVFLVPSLVVYGEVPGSGELRPSVLGLGLVQLGAALTIAVAAWWAGRVEFFRSLLIGGATLGGLFLGLLLLRISGYSRPLLLVGSALVLSSSVLPGLWSWSRRLVLAIGGAVVAGALVVALAGGMDGVRTLVANGEGSGSSEMRREIVPAVYHTVQASYYPELIPSTDRTGGAIENLGEDLLVVTAPGDLYRVRIPADAPAPTATHLGIRAPLNHEAFSSAVANEVDTNWFRTTDVLVEDLGDRVRLLVSHHHWREDEGCFVLRLSWLEVPEERLEAAGESARWNTLYETSPCLPVHDSDGRPFFLGLESGGRLARLGDGEYLMTVGDHAFNGLDTRRILSVPGAGDYGKILRVGIDGSSEVFTTGHRNPQGLTLQADGTIWSVEHGPEGGDELNRIESGRDYGWPFVTEGTQYGMDHWPLSDSLAGSGSMSPVYTWVPSVGTSSVTLLSGEQFQAWEGDLLVASLKGQSLYRLRTRDGRVLTAEPIAIDGRIRDVLEDSTGRIVLFLDSETLVTLTPAELTSNGEAIFAAQCSGCHEADGGGSSGIGPDLFNVFLRRIADEPDFQYSEALDSMTGEWNNSALDAYLADPQDFAPGTTMTFDGLSDPERRRALLAYLKSLQG